MLASSLLLGPLFAVSGCSQPFESDIPSAPSIISNAITALGGEKALSNLKGITYYAPSVYRSRSLMQGYSMNRADTPVAVTGSQNISFDFTTAQLQQRIDRNFVPSDYWSWAAPQLDRLNFSLVVRSGKDGFACYNRENNQLWLPTNMSSGYTDPALAEYLVLHGRMMSPKLLLEMRSSKRTVAEELNVNGVAMPAVSDPDSGLTVIMNPRSWLPYIVRTTEQHPVYGQSTFDLVFSNYTSAPGSRLKFPHLVQTIYNSAATPLDAPLEDFIIDSVDINPDFAEDFFEGIPENESMFPKTAPHKVEGVTHARLTEYSSNMLWSGIDNSTAKDLSVQAPVKGLPTVRWLVVKDDYLGVKQLIIEFEDEVIVGDAAPTWSLDVIQWINENIGKPITHVFPTHHHRDHSGGALDFVAVGAKLIVPEVAAKYWSNVPGAQIVTFNDTHPYMHKDAHIQVWFVWEQQATHAVDFAYAFITAACPRADSPAIVFEADVWHGGLSIENNDMLEMRAFLDQVRGNGLTRDAIIYPTHGQIRPLTDLISDASYVYPSLKTTDWMGGKAVCKK